MVSQFSANKFVARCIRNRHDLVAAFLSFCDGRNLRGKVKDINASKSEKHGLVFPL